MIFGRTSSRGGRMPWPAVIALVVAVAAPRAYVRATSGGSRSQPPEDKVHRTARTPDVKDIPSGGTGRNLRLVGHNPLLDTFEYVNEPLGIPRGSNGDITASDDCVYVGSFVGYQPALIVDVSNPRRPEVVGPVPDLVPGVGNGIEGIEANGNLLVIDQREALGDLGFDVPDGLPSRGLAIYDISANCRRPRLVARYDFGNLDTHTVSLWRDPEDPQRVLAIESFIDHPDVKVLDLTGCPRDCEPRLVAEWDLKAQTGIEGDFEHTHEAIMSTDGRRLYMSQLQAGFFMLDSSALIAALRGGPSCNPQPPQSPTAKGHCLTLLNPDIEAREDSAPPLSGEWYHTSIKVPDRPYLVQLQESSGPEFVPEDPLGPIRSNCPGALVRLLYVGEDEFHHPTGEPMRGDLSPETVGVYGLPEQRLENCGPTGFKPGTAPRIAWFSPHDALVLRRLVMATYYGAGVRAIDFANPFVPVEAGHFFNKPVRQVRWCSYGPCRDPVLRPDGLALRRPVAGPPQMFAFSYVLSHNGLVIYADVHSGLYILKYQGPHVDEIPRRGNCISGNPGAVAPGFEPCPPYGRTEWGTPGE
jgi:hypothetical protein